MLMGYPVNINQELENPSNHQHEKVFCDITLGKDIGFRWNKQNNSYELVTDLQTWSHSLPPERLLDQITQNYAMQTLTATAKLEGFEEEEVKTNDRGEVELVFTRWT